MKQASTSEVLDCSVPHPYVHRAYDLALVVTAVALPFSNFLMSQGAFLMLFAWGIDRWKGGPMFRGRGWTFWRRQPTWWAVSALFISLIAGLLWTEDFSAGARVLRIQLPMLAFPLVLLTGRWNQARALRTVKWSFTVAVLAAAIACLYVGWTEKSPLKARDWSPFISHIRFSLMIALAWSWWLWEAVDRTNLRALLIALVVGLIGGAVIWKSATLTGVILLPLCALSVMWMRGVGFFPIPLAQVRKVLCGLMIGATMVLVVSAWQLWPHVPKLQDMARITDQGAPYLHHADRVLQENGQHVWINIAPEELDSAWGTRSTLSIHGQDGRQQELRMTLMRYLSSKGFRKDAAGVNQLSDSDLERIEKGIPTVLEWEHKGLRRRLDIIQFELENWIDGGDPSGHSVAQRLAFLEAAAVIAKKNPLLGVGTGDVQRAFDRTYDELASRLQPRFRLRAHNQYMTFFITGGPVCLLLWLTVLGTLFFMPKTSVQRPLAHLFLLIIVLSCLSEDTLETQAGVTFFGFFLGLLGRRFPEGSGPQND